MKRNKFETFKHIAEQINLIKITDSQQSVSFSQYELYSKCKLSWYLKYVSKLAPRENTIHTLFGTAIHETIQYYVTQIYTVSAKSADEIDLVEYYYDRFAELYRQYKEEGSINITKEESIEFYRDAKEVLKGIKSKRSVYFPSRGHQLVGIELPIMLDIGGNIVFKGFIDIIIYDEVNDQYIIYDLKTSKAGWHENQKKDRVKTAQMVAYRKFFAKQYGIPIERVRCEYIIFRRKVDPTADFPLKRIQHFIPPVGPRITKDFEENLNEFITTSMPNGIYEIKQPMASPDKHSCRFCFFKDKKHLCKFGINS